MKITSILKKIYNILSSKITFITTAIKQGIIVFNTFRHDIKDVRYFYIYFTFAYSYCILICYEKVLKLSHLHILKEKQLAIEARFKELGLILEQFSTTCVEKNLKLSGVLIPEITPKMLANIEKKLYFYFNPQDPTLYSQLYKDFLYIWNKIIFPDYSWYNYLFCGLLIGLIPYTIFYYYKPIVGAIKLQNDFVNKFFTTFVYTSPFRPNSDMRFYDAYLEYMQQKALGIPFLERVDRPIRLTQPDLILGISERLYKQACIMAKNIITTINVGFDFEKFKKWYIPEPWLEKFLNHPGVKTLSYRSNEESLSKLIYKCQQYVPPAPEQKAMFTDLFVFIEKVLIGQPYIAFSLLALMIGSMFYYYKKYYK